MTRREAITRWYQMKMNHFIPTASRLGLEMLKSRQEFEWDCIMERAGSIHFDEDDKYHIDNIKLCLKAIDERLKNETCT